MLFRSIRALKGFPSQNVYYEEVDGKPAAITPANINFGLAIDIPKPDGTRALLVPNIKKAQRLNFAEYLNAYEDLVKKLKKSIELLPHHRDRDTEIENYFDSTHEILSSLDAWREDKDNKSTPTSTET